MILAKFQGFVICTRYSGEFVENLGLWLVVYKDRLIKYWGRSCEAIALNGGAMCAPLELRLYLYLGDKAGTAATVLALFVIVLVGFLL